VAIAHDQDGGVLSPFNTGCDFTDISNVQTLVKNQNPPEATDKYRGRGDYDADGGITFVDISFVQTQAKRSSNDIFNINGASSIHGCNGNAGGPPDLAYCSGVGPPAGCP